MLIQNTHAQAHSCCVRQRNRRALRRGAVAFICLLSAALRPSAVQAQNTTALDVLEETQGNTSCMSIGYQAMGAQLEFRVYPPEPEMMEEELRHYTDQAYSAIIWLEERISSWRENSKTSYVNRHAAEGPTETSSELISLLGKAQDLYAQTDGAFDVTVGPLLELWGFYKKAGHLPSEEEVKQSLEKVGLNKVVVDAQARTVKFEVAGMRLDFGGIGKGLALDRASEVLKDKGFKSGMLHAGTSTLVAIGAPPGQRGWTVRIRSPYNETKSFVDEVQINNESLSTSSGAERFFELEGKRYSHIFNPKTGYPVEGVLSATAIAPTGMQSDALSTAFFVFGKEKTEAYCAQHPEVRAILVVEEAGEAKVLRINFN